MNSEQSTQIHDQTTPLWFLDVDGVINAFPNHSKDDTLHYRTFNASPNRWRGMTEEDKYDALLMPGGTHRYKITYDPTIIERILAMHNSGIVRVVWLTTWGSGANNELRERLKWPRLLSAGDPTYRHAGGWSGSSLMHTDEHGTWWKLNTLRAFREKYPESTKFVWTDDHLAMEGDANLWAKNSGGLPIAPDETTGLTHAQLDRIEEYLTTQQEFDS